MVGWFVEKRWVSSLGVWVIVRKTSLNLICGWYWIHIVKRNVKDSCDYRHSFHDWFAWYELRPNIYVNLFILYMLENWSQISNTVSNRHYRTKLLSTNQIWISYEISLKFNLFKCPTNTVLQNSTLAYTVVGLIKEKPKPLKTSSLHMYTLQKFIMNTHNKSQYNFDIFKINHHLL